MAEFRVEAMSRFEHREDVRQLTDITSRVYSLVKRLQTDVEDLQRGRAS